MKESTGWQQVFTSPRLDWVIDRVALNAKVMAGSLGDNDKMVAVASGTDIILWSICPDGNGNEIGESLAERVISASKILGFDVTNEFCLDFAGVFSLNVPVEALFFVGNQLIATSHTGKVGVWNAVTKHWQVGVAFQRHRVLHSIWICIPLIIVNHIAGSQNQDVVPISSYDTAGSFLILGCNNGSIYYIGRSKCFRILSHTKHSLPFFGLVKVFF